MTATNDRSCIFVDSIEYWIWSKESTYLIEINKWSFHIDKNIFLKPWACNELSCRRAVMSWFIIFSPHIHDDSPHHKLHILKGFYQNQEFQLTINNSVNEFWWPTLSHEWSRHKFLMIKTHISDDQRHEFCATCDQFLAIKWKWAISSCPAIKYHPPGSKIS